MGSPGLKTIHQKSRDRGLSFEYHAGAGGDSMILPIEKADGLLELRDDGTLRCQFGVDMDELRTLVAGPGNEDIAEDELQRVARDHLRPLSRKFGPGLRKLGYEETVDTAAEHYAISFEKRLDLSDPAAVLAEIQSCLSLFG